MADTATLPRPRARPRALTLEQAGAELGVPGVVMRRHDEAVQAGTARPHSFPPVHDLAGQRVIERADFDEFFLAPDDGVPVIGYGLMATWADVKDQTVRSRLRGRRRLNGRLAPALPPPHTYVTVEYELKDGGLVERDEPRWRPAVYRHWCQTVSLWLMPDGVTPQRPRRAGRPRTRHP